MTAGTGYLARRRPKRETIGHMTNEPATDVLGADLPAGTRFIGPAVGSVAGWTQGREAPATSDLDMCVACGLCLPHCPTYRLTGEESASPRGRIAAMRAIDDGRAEPDTAFMGFVDLCLACRACETVCPSHVGFGRMVEAAREQVEPLRTRRERFLKWLGLEVVLPRPRLVKAAAIAGWIARPLLPQRLRGSIPQRVALGRLPALTNAIGKEKGPVAVLSGCVQDHWFRDANLATIRMLSRAGWRVVVPRDQVCCGALSAHHGRMPAAERMAERNREAFGGADFVVVNAAGCSAHMKEQRDLEVKDAIEFLAEQELPEPNRSVGATVAYHDACHARVQGIRTQPRVLLERIPGLELIEIPEGDTCCGAAGLYSVLQPATSSELRRRKSEAIASTGASIVASANPGCSLQLELGLREIGSDIRVQHPVELLDRSYPGTA
jgi:glycolate oxidase iron-sulfur subunit